MTPLRILHLVPRTPQATRCPTCHYWTEGPCTVCAAPPRPPTLPPPCTRPRVQVPQVHPATEAVLQTAMAWMREHPHAVLTLVDLKSDRRFPPTGQLRQVFPSVRRLNLAARARLQADDADGGRG